MHNRVNKLATPHLLWVFQQNCVDNLSGYLSGYQHIPSSIFYNTLVDMVITMYITPGVRVHVKCGLCGLIGQLKPNLFETQYYTHMYTLYIHIMALCGYAYHSTR